MLLPFSLFWSTTTYQRSIAKQNEIMVQTSLPESSFPINTESKQVYMEEPYLQICSGFVPRKDMKISNTAVQINCDDYSWELSEASINLLQENLYIIENEYNPDLTSSIWLPIHPLNQAFCFNSNSQIRDPRDYMYHMVLESTDNENYKFTIYRNNELSEIECI